MRWEGSRSDGFRTNTLSGTYNRQYFLLTEPVLGLFSTEVEFQKYVNDSSIVSPPLVDGFQQMEGVHRLDEGDVREDEFELVGLEMADEMPLDVGGHLRNLGRQFLGTVLAEDALAGFIGLHQPGDRVEFGNCHQFHG